VRSYQAFISSYTHLAERCDFIAMSGYCHDMLSVCLSVVTQAFCDKQLYLESCSFKYSVAQCLSSWPAKFDDEIRRESPRPGGGHKLGSGSFLTSWCMVYLENDAR